MKHSRRVNELFSHGYYLDYESKCPMWRAGARGFTCGRCWQAPEGLDECLDEAIGFESMTNPTLADLEDEGFWPETL
jgi:hypothetical protein